LGGAFLLAGLFARLGKKIGLPTIPFFMLAGIVVGPNTPGFVLVEHPAEFEVLAAVGLVLLLFHLGLEFSLDGLTTGGSKLLWVGVAYVVLNVGGGLALGAALGWGTREMFVIAGAIGISSSAIVTKLLVELGRLSNRETPVILGIIIVEDVFLALYLALLQPVLGDAGGTGEAILLVLRAFGFLLLLFLIARFGAKWVSRLIGSEDDEILTILFMGLVILVAGISEELGVSDAIGALMVGLILAETRYKGRIEKLVLPLRDAFAAVFFFAFGLTIDPAAFGGVLRPVLAAVGITFVMNIGAGIIAARAFGFGRYEAANAGLSLLGRGEFSLILVAVALLAGLDERLGPFVAEYVLILAIGGPLLASRSGSISRLLPARLFAKQTPESP
jgi:CPA2 family monovalent cation:H+ antiporter-2